MAASNLVPVTLELGGKSPCIVESDANITIAAKRIAVAEVFQCRANVCDAGLFIGTTLAKKEVLIEALKITLSKLFRCGCIAKL
jgi:aldehyde dehydrogenase (NAD+)